MRTISNLCRNATSIMQAAITKFLKPGTFGLSADDKWRNTNIFDARARVRVQYVQAERIARPF